MAHHSPTRSRRFQTLYDLLTGGLLIGGADRALPIRTDIPDHLRSDVGLPDVQTDGRTNHPLGTLRADIHRY
ncbi:hypothetical protein KUL25_04070 [Rhodobacteraceae bacterium N5(2021)]|uniref:Uncharacterized protein n=1 Tax=Gymnodinialimonas phycosphaerae TaxID=2841589 RepID=A0A975TWW9_9RHOB|nr:hypothetical protein [Gymnodinialimonas phycosphaerae]MBY4891938.1 hypothetical protein [Gymnodinialimonas phycosphaerae]